MVRMLGADWIGIRYEILGRSSRGGQVLDRRGSDETGASDVPLVEAQAIIPHQGQRFCGLPFAAQLSKYAFERLPHRYLRSCWFLVCIFFCFSLPERPLQMTSCVSQVFC